MYFLDKQMPRYQRYILFYPASIMNETIDDLMQVCSNSIANALELLQSCTKLSISSSISSYIHVHTNPRNKMHIGLFKGNIRQKIYEVGLMSILTTLHCIYTFTCPWQASTRACLGHVAPIGRPRSVYKSNVECSFLNRNDGQMTLKFKANDLNFQ